jgi:hypothetical protein
LVDLIGQGLDMVRGQHGQGLALLDGDVAGLGLLIEVIADVVQGL